MQHRTSAKPASPHCRDCDAQIDSSPVYGDTDSRIYICGKCWNVNAFSLDLVI